MNTYVQNMGKSYTKHFELFTNIKKQPTDQYFPKKNSKIKNLENEKKKFQTFFKIRTARYDGKGRSEKYTFHALKASRSYTDYDAT